MPLSNPAFETILERIRADFEGLLTGADAHLPTTIEAVEAIVLARGVKDLYENHGFLADEINPLKCSANQLRFWGDLLQVYRIEATKGSYPYEFTGTNGTGIPAGTAVVRSDGKEYETTALVTIAGGVATATIIAAQSGTASNLTNGQTLTLKSAIAGVDAEGTVQAGGTDAIDLEDLEVWRGRVLQALREPNNKYETWALGVSGVTRVWVRARARGNGTVDIYFVRDGDGYGNAILPSGAEVAAVQTVIDNNRPPTADVLVKAPAEKALTLTVKLSPNTAAVQAAAEAQLQAMLLREAEPEDGAGSGKILLSKIDEAIALATGEDDHLITLVNGLAPADIAPATGEMVILNAGAITWQAF